MHSYRISVKTDNVETPINLIAYEEVFEVLRITMARMDHLPAVGIIPPENFVCILQSLIASGARPAGMSNSFSKCPSTNVESLPAIEINGTHMGSLVVTPDQYMEFSPIGDSCSLLLNKLSEPYDTPKIWSIRSS